MENVISKPKPKPKINFDAKFAKVVVFINALVPLAILLFDAFRQNLGANPVEFALRTTGFLTLIFLLITLAVTPIRKLLGLNELVKLRRMLGLYSFFYAFLHFTIYIWLDRAFGFFSTLGDIVQRPFIALGMAAFFLLIPLAVTSTKAMIKKIRCKKWKKLNCLTYYIAILGVIHFYLIVKSDVRLPLAFAVVLAILLGYRIYTNNQKPSGSLRTTVVPR